MFQLQPAGEIWGSCRAKTGSHLLLPVLRLTLEDNRSIGANEHGAGTHTTDRTSRALLVDGNVATHDNSVAAVPRLGLHPVDAVEEGGGRAVAGVLRVDTLNVKVAVLGKEVHKEGLGRLGLVNDSLSADVEATDRLGVDVVLLEELRDDSQGDRVDVLADYPSVTAIPSRSEK